MMALGFTNFLFLILINLQMNLNNEKKKLKYIYKKLLKKENIILINLTNYKINIKLKNTMINMKKIFN